MYSAHLNSDYVSSTQVCLDTLFPATLNSVESTVIPFFIFIKIPSKCTFLHVNTIQNTLLWANNKFKPKAKYDSLDKLKIISIENHWQYIENFQSSCNSTFDHKSSKMNHQLNCFYFVYFVDNLFNDTNQT